MKHKMNDPPMIMTDEFFKGLPKPTITIHVNDNADRTDAELPPLADERVKFCAEINRLNRENEELRANQIKGLCMDCVHSKLVDCNVVGHCTCVITYNSGFNQIIVSNTHYCGFWKAWEGPRRR